jgi:small conductance mechanosensitive channel
MDLSPDIVDPIVALALNVLAAAATLALGWVFAGWVDRTVRRVTSRNPRVDVTLAGVAARVLRALVIVFTLVAVLDRFGVQTTSLVALIGAAGLAIGLSLQGALANVAAGVLVLTLRPFKVGDAVMLNGIAGAVEDIGLFITKLRTFEGVVVFMPNGTIWGKEVQNFSQAQRRRADLTFGIGYGDDMDAAIRAIRAVLEGDARVLAEPEPVIAVDGLGDSSVDILCRFWTAPADLFTTRWAITQAVKARFDAEGISIPFPQRDVHLIPAPGEEGRPAA